MRSGADAPFPVGRPRSRRGACVVLGVAAVTAVVVITTGACAGRDGGEVASPTTAPNDAPAVTGTVVVLAASSLADVFTQIAADVERAHPGVDVQVSAGSSSALAQQIVDGAPATVFASADRSAMERIGSRAVTPAVFATNQLVIAVPAGNPAGVSDLSVFGDTSRRTGLCAESAPCGRYARRVLERSGVSATPVTEEPDVRSLLAKVASGDLDAGIVYATDVRSAAGSVVSVAIPEADQVDVEYLIAATTSPTGGPPSAASTAFVDWVLGPGQLTLSAAGFGAP